MMLACKEAWIRNSDHCHRAMGRSKSECIRGEDEFAVSSVLWLMVAFYRETAG